MFKCMKMCEVVMFKFCSVEMFRTFKSIEAIALMLLSVDIWVWVFSIFTKTQLCSFNLK